MTDTRRGATAIIAAGVALAVVAGLVITGGPGAARQQARDDTRLQDLRQISANIRCQADATGRTPDAPRQTDLCPSPFAMQNPRSGETYAYARLDDRHWRLCAPFEQPERVAKPARDHQFDPRAGCLIGSLDRPEGLRFAPLVPFDLAPRD